MPRGPRLAFEHAFFHVYNRGVAKQPIFLDEGDYQYFLKKLKDLKEKKHFDHEIYAYVLMPNHFHVLIQANRVPIGKVMASLSTSYSMYFNKKYHRVGPLFQNRFKSKLCNRDTYFLGASRYILLNPVEAGIATRIEDYPWSSYYELFGFQSILTPDVRRLIGENEKEKETYRQFLFDGTKRTSDIAKEYTFERDIEGAPRFQTLTQKKWLRRRNKTT